MRKMIEIKIKVPENLDRLIRELSKMDGTDVTEFYQDQLLESLSGQFNTGQLFNLEGLAENYDLHTALKGKGLDESMYGKK